jgi:hypothetical protein
VTLLNEADAIYLGALAADAVYLGTEKVWSAELDPTSIAGLTVWLDASQLGLADGAYVNTWPSLVSPFLVGTNFNVVPYRPVMRTNARNGLAVVRFSSGGGLRWPNNGLDLNWTVIYVGRMWGTALGRVVSGSYPPANVVLGYHGGFEDKAYVEGWLLPDVSHAQTTNWKLYTGVGEGVPGNATATFYSNGTYLSGGQAGSQNGGGWKGTFQLSGYSPTSGEETCDCEIAEVLIYNRRLSDADRISVETYLRTKWGLP